MRALARNEGWSSTMRTVRHMASGSIVDARKYAAHTAGRTQLARGVRDRAEGSLWVGGAEHRRAGHEHGRPRARARARGAPRRSPPSTSSAVPSRSSPRSRPILSDRAREERLAAPARVHRHAEDEVDVVDELAHDLGRRARVERQAGAAAGVADGGERVVGVRRGLDVDRDAVGARVGEGGDVALGPLDHQVDVDVAAGLVDLVGERRDDRAAPCSARARSGRP